MGLPCNELNILSVAELISKATGDGKLLSRCHSCRWAILLHMLTSPVCLPETCSGSRRGLVSYK